MKMEFRGVARQVLVHKHPCSNLRWKTGLEALTTIRGVGLNGDFRVTLCLEEIDLQNCLEALVKSDPERALKMASRIQAEAVIALSKSRAE